MYHGKSRNAVNPNPPRVANAIASADKTSNRLPSTVPALKYAAIKFDGERARRDEKGKTILNFCFNALRPHATFVS